MSGDWRRGLYAGYRLRNVCSVPITNECGARAESEHMQQELAVRLHRRIESHGSHASPNQQGVALWSYVGRIDECFVVGTYLHEDAR